MKETTFTLDDLKTGMRVETTDGMIGIVMKDTDEGAIVVQEGFWFNVDDVNFEEDYADGDAISKVYSQPSDIIRYCDFNFRGDVIWERSSQEMTLEEMTLEEIEEALGKKIKIVESK